MEKVKLPREVAEALDKLLGAKWSKVQIINNLGLSVEGPILRLTGFAELHGYDTLLQALVNGYEVEETPEDKAVQWLMEQDMIHRENAERWVRKIKEILEGVNA